MKVVLAYGLATALFLAARYVYREFTENPPAPTQSQPVN